MPFEKGKSGNPGGQTNHREFAAALRIAIMEAAEEGGTKLRRVANALVKKASDGDVSAIKEIADRLDGKVAQQLQHTGNEGGEIVFRWQATPDADS